MVDLPIVYDRPSRVVSDDSSRLTVALAIQSPTIGGAPVFFDGWLAQPRLVAALLLSMGAVAGARYFMPQSTRLLDPVLTSGDGLLRIEAFSSCGGVYARVDLQGERFGEASIGFGTTNVDLGDEIRDALTRADDANEVRLSVGNAGVRVTTSARSTTERKVKLPVRWIKGFGGAALAQVGMQPVGRLGPVGARQFLAALPPAGSASSRPYVLAPTRSGLRFSQSPSPAAVQVAGPHRLRELRPLARYATGLRVWARPDGGAGNSAFELTVPGARVWFVLSAEVTRGFSGEGAGLDLLTDASSVSQALELHGSLGWQSRLDEDELARRAALSPARVRALLTVLGSQGLVGWDLDAEAWFRRDLPFAAELIPNLAPRVAKAATIRRSDVEIRNLAAGGCEVFVRSGDIEHRVVLSDEPATCTCRWFTRHSGARGACRHVLAARRYVGEAS